MNVKKKIEVEVKLNFDFNIKKNRSHQSIYSIIKELISFKRGSKCNYNLNSNKLEKKQTNLLSQIIFKVHMFWEV